MIKKTSGSCNTRRTAPSLKRLSTGEERGRASLSESPSRGLLALIVFLKALYAHFGGPGRTDGAGNGLEGYPIEAKNDVVLYGTP